MTVAAKAAVSVRLKEAFFTSDPSAPPKPVHVRDWKQYPAGGERIGALTAPVTVVMFADFQCPFCREAAGELRRLRAMHPNEFAVVYRHFPLGIHGTARAAARASICAGRQREFEPMYEQLFAEQDSLGRIPWARLAADAGVNDTSTFDTCMSDTADPSVLAQIRRDSVAGARLGVRGTPTLLMNDLRVVGDPGEAALASYIQAAFRDDQKTMQQR